MAFMPLKDNCKKLKDEELVSAVLKEPEYFRCLVDRYSKKLFYYIKRIGNLRDEDIEDLLQDVFIKVYRNLNDFDTSLKFSSWIYRITHNEVISNFRKIKVRPQKDWDEEFVNKIIYNFSIEDKIDNEILRKNIDKILSEMDVKYREVLVLKFLEERDYKEISDILKKPVGTVGTLINRAKKDFLKKISPKNKLFNIWKK